MSLYRGIISQPYVEAKRSVLELEFESPYGYNAQYASWSNARTLICNARFFNLCFSGLLIAMKLGKPEC
ncbi:unnamed protein product [Protopolystoma xenopodis]|uniref:Uncharacterized protein n=1 Tax=Protopolystoma xenopodis TaxID=117903 RepID=A0A448XMW5_9PLAT|nr:unnamed protein product [Protopolystoma xenopodis]